MGKIFSKRSNSSWVDSGKNILSFASIYLALNVIYQQAYLSEIGFKFGLFALVQSFPIYTNYIVVIYAVLLWLGFRGISRSAYAQIIGFFQFSSWRELALIKQRIISVLLLLGYYSVTLAVFILGKPHILNSTNGTTSLDIYAAWFFALLLLPSVILWYLYKHSDFGKNVNITWIKQNLFSVLLLIAGTILTIVELISFIDFAANVNWKLFVIDFTWHWIWPGSNFLTWIYNLSFFLFLPFAWITISILLYKNIRRRGLYQLEYRRTASRHINLISPTLTAMLVFGAVAVLPSLYGQQVARTTLERMLVQNYQKVETISVKDDQLICGKHSYHMYYLGKLNGDYLFVFLESNNIRGVDRSICLVPNSMVYSLTLSSVP